jgi:GTP-binding protein EngB required for normal cell division
MLAALDEALDALDGRVPDPALMDRARALSTRAGERLRLSGEHTVVALAGSTGSGKSSLFNVLSGDDISPAGVRRPTTAKAYASVWGSDGAAPLVQWLGVPRRQTTWQRGPGLRAEEIGELDGLVLLDLPDHDSNVVEHQHEVDRLVDLVDLLVWVVDPQKYADELLHERYLRRLTGHQAVTVVVLNQVDTVNPFAAAACADDLRRLLDEDGLRRSPVLTTSARTGAGIDGLRALLADAVVRRRARNDRLVADLEDIVEALAPSVSAGEPTGMAATERGRLVAALATSAGVPAIGSAVEESWKLRAGGLLGWPPTRWVRRLRPDPLRRLHLKGQDKRDVRTALVRSSVPEPTPVQRAQVDTALRQACDAVAADLPAPWQRSVRAAADGRSADVRDRLDQAVVGTDLGVDRVPIWWRAGAALQWAVTAAAVVGGLWLLALAFGGYLRLPDPPTPEVGGVAVPTMLLIGGILLGLLLAAVGRLLVRGGAVARRKRAESRLRASIERVADELVLMPVAAELERHARARLALERARTG